MLRSLLGGPGDVPVTPVQRDDLVVAHLLWAPLGCAPLERFLDSLRRHRAGLEHRLVIIFNGYDGRTDPRLAHTERALEGVEYEAVRMAEPVLDLEAYRLTASRLQSRWICFLNSYCEVLADDWLALLAKPTQRARIGAVAATGSWGSQASHLRYGLGLGGAYAGVFPDRASTARVFSELAGASVLPASGRSGPARAISTLTTAFRQAVGFPQFPCPHLRTNGLLIERHRWLQICRRSPRDKLGAHRMESGRHSITTKLLDAGLEVLVAGRDGQSYGVADWPASRTFWQGAQENLIIGDNQTGAYASGDTLKRRVLSGYAWGDLAAPTA